MTSNDRQNAPETMAQAPSRSPVETKSGDPPITQRPLVIGISLLLFFPLGLYFVWKHPSWSVNQKRIWTGGLVAYLLLLGATGSESEDRNGDNQGVTADFLPYKKGARARYYIEMIPPSGGSVATEHTYDYEGGDVIHHTLASVGTMNGDEYVSQTYQNKGLADQYQRVRNGFVETKGESGDWTLELKIGGRAGDTWESNKGKTRTTIEKFGSYPLRYDGSSRRSVETTQTITTGAVTTLAKFTYVEGIGLVEKDVFVVKDGSQNLVSRWRLDIPTKDMNLSKSERRFFE